MPEKSLLKSFLSDILEVYYPDLISFSKEKLLTQTKIIVRFNDKYKFKNIKLIKRYKLN